MPACLLVGHRSAPSSAGRLGPAALSCVKPLRSIPSARTPLARLPGSDPLGSKSRIGPPLLGPPRIRTLARSDPRDLVLGCAGSRHLAALAAAVLVLLVCAALGCSIPGTLRSSVAPVLTCFSSRLVLFSFCMHECSLLACLLDCVHAFIYDCVRACVHECDPPLIVHLFDRVLDFFLVIIRCLFDSSCSHPRRCSATPLLTSPVRLIRSAAPAHSCPNARSPPAISCSDDPSLGCSAIRRSSVLLLGFPVARLLRCLAFGCSGGQHCGLGHSARPAQHVEARPLGSCATPQRSSHPSGSSQAIGL